MPDIDHVERMSYQDRGAVAVTILTGYLSNMGGPGVQNLWTTGDRERVERLVLVLMGPESAEGITVEPWPEFAPTLLGWMIRLDQIERFGTPEYHDRVGWLIPTHCRGQDGETLLGPFPDLDSCQRWQNRYLPVTDLVVDVEVVE